MLETVKNAFRIKDIRKKVLFTFLMLVVVRLGSQLPVRVNLGMYNVNKLAN